MALADYCVLVFMSCEGESSGCTTAVVIVVKYSVQKMQIDGVWKPGLCVADNLQQGRRAAGMLNNVFCVSREARSRLSHQVPSIANRV